jgi:hypothetical protein
LVITKSQIPHHGCDVIELVVGDRIEFDVSEIGCGFELSSGLERRPTRSPVV